MRQPSPCVRAFCNSGVFDMSIDLVEGDVPENDVGSYPNQTSNTHEVAVGFFYVFSPPCCRGKSVAQP
jgi:hypothetical protein